MARGDAGGRTGFWGGGAPQTQQAPPQQMPQPYTTGPGLQPGQAQPQFENFDFSKAGAGETNFAQNQQVWNTPSFGEQNAQNIVGQYGAGTPGVTQSSRTMFDQFQQSSPADMSAYFDNAKNRAAESIAQSNAALGAYGNSSARDQTARAFTDLEGQRALKEADYGLQRFGMGGNLAGAADQSSLASSQNEKDWQAMLASLGLDASQLGLQRTNAGQDAANSAQGAQRARGQDAFNNQQSEADRIQAMLEGAYYPGLATDADLLDRSISGGLAGGNNAASQEQQNAQNTLDYGKTALGAYDYFRRP